MLKLKLSVLLLFSFVSVLGQQSPRILIKENQETVVAGYIYCASFYLINVKADDVEYYFYDKLLEKDTSGGGVLKFKTSGGAYDVNGQCKKAYQITAKYKDNNKLVSISEEFIYTIKRPVLYIDSPVEKILYYNCGNELTVRCTDIGNSFNPDYSTNSATIIRGAKKGQLVLLPKEEKVYLEIKDNGNSIDGKLFFAINPPIPTIKILKDSIEIDSTITSKSKISISVVPDISFFTNYPKDARYKIQRWTFTVLRSGKELIKRYFTETSLDLSSLDVKLVNGDILIVDIKGIDRINFLNQIIPEKNISKIFIMRVL